MQESALSGLTVVELSEQVSGPYCARLLGALGAEVIKVEKAPSGDRARNMGPFISDEPDPEMSALFLYLNTNKKSVTLEWETSAGREILERVLMQADVLVESFPPGYMDSHGLSFESLQKINPRLIIVSMSDFGSSGPYRDWTATPQVNLALGGYMYLSGEETREPLSMPGHQADYLAGLHAYLGCLMALWYRDDSGLGQRVEVATMESLAALSQFTTVMHTYNDTIRRRHGNRWESASSYGSYPNTVLPCKDGHVSFTVSTEKQWELLCVMIGRPDLLDDPRMLTFQNSRSHADEIDEMLLDWLKDRTKQEVFQTASGLWSVPVAPVSQLSEVLDDPQYRSRELCIEIDHPSAGLLTYPTVPFKMSGSPPRFERAPLLGEHNYEVYCSILGYTDGELANFSEMGVV